MYPISTPFQQVIAGRNRRIEWYGTLTLKSGTQIHFEAEDIMQGSGSLTCSCDLPAIGGAVSTCFQVQLYLDLTARQLENASINLYAGVAYSETTGHTWGDLAAFYWRDLESATWGEDSWTIETDVPMGHFIVSEAKREINSIKIVAYDPIILFDEPLPTLDTTAKTPFAWARFLCSSCGVSFGMTQNEVLTFPNGNRNFVYAGVNSDVTTCRKLLAQLAAAIGAVAASDRLGRLVFLPWKGTAATTVTQDQRFSSDFSDYQYNYTGLWAQYKAGALQEYYTNAASAQTDTGGIVNLGANVFLQISDEANRKTCIQAIIDTLKNVNFTPFDVSMPFNPAYDLLDTIAFTGGHAPTNSLGPITSITRKIGGEMTLRCDTPEKLESPVRETVQVDGLSGNTEQIEENGFAFTSSGFWILINDFPDAAVTVGASDTLTTELTINCTVDNTATQIAWTAAYTLDEAATVTAKVVVDGEEIYTVADDQTRGKHVLNITTGHTFDTQGEHTVAVYLREDIT